MYVSLYVTFYYIFSFTIYVYIYIYIYIYNTHHFTRTSTTQTHTSHDYIAVDRKRPTGVRVLTAYLYLNDVEAGGGTRFPKLKTPTHPKGLTAMPKQGRLLLWPSVKDEEPNQKDFRTDHEALSVEKGEKYGANGWIHMRDFKTPHGKGCT